MKLTMVALAMAALAATQMSPDTIRTSDTYATTAPAAWADADPADSLYRAARRALTQKDYEEAARLFETIVVRHPRSEYAPDALYWKGFALYKNGNIDDAVDALTAQAKRYPKAATISDASALLIVLKGQLAMRGDSSARRDVDDAAMNPRATCGNMEVQIAALDAVQQMDAERVMPLLRKVMARRDACSTPLRKSALFILSQKSGADRETILLEVAKSDPSVDVRADAVFHLSQARSDAAVGALEDLLLHADDRGVRSNALFALSQNKSDRAKRIIKTFALSDNTPIALRNDAIFHLAQNKGSDDSAWLNDAFTKITDREVRKTLLFFIAQRRDQSSLEKLISIAKTDPSPDLRKDALFYIGQSKDPRALRALEEIVNP